MREDLNEKLIMGVGSGSDNLFVSGDYESITALQNKLFELEELRRENENLKKEVQRLENISKEITPTDYICGNIK